MNLKKMINEINKDRPRVLVFPTSLDAKKVAELTPDHHRMLAEETAKRIQESEDK